MGGVDDRSMEKAGAKNTSFCVSYQGNSELEHASSYSQGEGGQVLIPGAWLDFPMK